ncbi:MAG: type II secretion system protein [Sulfuricurvum sp.]|uniref:type II secretion system protein n=1 Tax=Sulfuricurvum sp. TaxID=2025608 RepID=UPI002733ADB5|nr:type II secretion system protein [Sulfuricurvum sp.]MDP2849791.1 type II secretion system protein [Sulfuricurvum sp.]
MKPINNRKAFTMIELLFVMVIMGIVGGLALEVLRQYYDGIYRTGEYSKRVAQADHILEQVSKYFENGISASIIRLDQNNVSFGSQCDGIPVTGDEKNDYTIAFVAVDNDGLRGFWNAGLGRWLSGWTSDVLSVGNTLISADANYTSINPGNSLVGAAIFRSDGMGEGADECHRFGWDLTGAANVENHVYATIQSVDSDTALTLDKVLSISGQASRAYVMRTAYAFRAKNGLFNMYTGFEPWNNEQYSGATARLLADKVTHFTILYDNSNTVMNSNVGNIYTLKICLQGLDENLSDSNLSANQICRERMVHVRY